MRALAQELAVPVMTLYTYVPNRDALYDLVTDHVLHEVEVPGPETGSWEDRLRVLERDARQAMAAYPGVRLNRRGGASPEAARLTQGVLSILESAGFDPAGSRLAFATLFTFMLGQIELDTYEDGAVSAETIESVTAATGLSRDELFEFGFDAVLEGLKAKLKGPRSRSEGRR